MKDIKDNTVKLILLVIFVAFTPGLAAAQARIQYDLGPEVSLAIQKELESYPASASWGIIFHEAQDSVRCLTLFPVEKENVDDPLNIVLSRSNRCLLVNGRFIPIVFPSDLDFGVDFRVDEKGRVYPFIHGLEIRFVGSGPAPKVIRVSKSG